MIQPKSRPKSRIDVKLERDLHLVCDSGPMADVEIQLGLTGHGDWSVRTTTQRSQESHSQDVFPCPLRLRPASPTDLSREETEGNKQISRSRSCSQGAHRPWTAPFPGMKPASASACGRRFVTPQVRPGHDHSHSSRSPTKSNVVVTWRGYHRGIDLELV